MKTVTVIGGGITGLSMMHYLQRLKRERKLDVKLILVESSPELGGKIVTVKDGQFIMETGADSIVARHESVMPLIEDLQLEKRVVYNGTGISYLYANNVLHAIPADTIFGIPMSQEALMESTLVSDEGKWEALKDFETRNENFTRDSSIGEFLEAFLGKELVENQIAPVLSGVFSGDLKELTLATTLPYLVDYKNDYGSIIKGLEAHKSRFQGVANKKFISFDGGMSVLIDRLEETLDEVSFLKGTATERIEKRGDSYRVELANGETIESDHVVLATSHHIAQQLLDQPELDGEFDQLVNSSLISVYLGFDIPDACLPEDGTGFIVSQQSDLQCNACTWSSRKWSHTSGEGNLLVRLFYKSSHPAYEKLKGLSNEGMVEAALSDIERSLGFQASPITAEVTNWSNLMPNYHLHHKTALNALESKMEVLLPNVKLAGSSYYGVGIGACIQNGKELAEKIADTLSE